MTAHLAIYKTASLIEECRIAIGRQRFRKGLTEMDRAFIETISNEMLKLLESTNAYIRLNNSEVS